MTSWQLSLNVHGLFQITLLTVDVYEKETVTMNQLTFLLPAVTALYNQYMLTYSTNVQIRPRMIAYLQKTLSVPRLARSLFHRSISQSIGRRTVRIHSMQ